MYDRVRFFLKRLGERLWVRPLAVAILSVGIVFLAKSMDNTELGSIVPEITPESIETLLSIISASMLVIATFSVSSMVAAYASASGTATPRSFSLVIADDSSQNALSTFIGAFIFSIVGLIALKNSFYDIAGRFTLFALTILVFVIVITTFVRWVDSIARLGRMGTIIDKVESAAAEALEQRRAAPHLGGVPEGTSRTGGQAIYGDSIGYVQRVDVSTLQTYAESSNSRITVAALPGTFAAPGRALAYVTPDSGEASEIDPESIVRAFLIDDNRIFDEDPRFGLIVLSEIASRALSPGINDPGTAIDVIGRFVRLFALWAEPISEEDKKAPDYDRVSAPGLSLEDMFGDAFTGIARDGAGTIEVAVRLQKALHSLSAMGDGAMQAAAAHHSRLALARAEQAMELSEDLEILRQLAAGVQGE